MIHSPRIFLGFMIDISLLYCSGLAQEFLLLIIKPIGIWGSKHVNLGQMWMLYKAVLLPPAVEGLRNTLSTLVESLLKSSNSQNPRNTTALVCTICHRMLKLG